MFLIIHLHNIPIILPDQKCACCCCIPKLCSQYGVHPAKRFHRIYGQHIAKKVGNPDITFGEVGLVNMLFDINQCKIVRYIRLCCGNLVEQSKFCLQYVSLTHNYFNTVTRFVCRSSSIYDRLRYMHIISLYIHNTSIYMQYFW